MLFRLINLLALFSCLSLMQPTAHAQSPNYLLIKEEAGVTVYRSETHEYGKLFAFKGVTTYDAPLAKVFYVLMDNEHRVEWVDRLYHATELERVNAHNYVLYQAFELPTLMSNRDYVYRGIATIEPDSGVVTLNMQSIEYPTAPETVGVRANLVDSSYVMTPLADGKTQLAVEIVTDPMGWLPAWLTNSIQEDWPVNTLNAIRGQLDKEYTGEYPLPPGAVVDDGDQDEAPPAPEADDGGDPDDSSPEADDGGAPDDSSPEADDGGDQDEGGGAE